MIPDDRNDGLQAVRVCSFVCPCLHRTKTNTTEGGSDAITHKV